MATMIRRKINKKFFFVHTALIWIPLLVNLIWVIALREYRGEFPSLPVDLDNGTIIFVFFMLLIVYLAVLLMYLFADSQRLVLIKGLTFNFNRKRLEFFLFIYITANIIFYLKTGIGKASSVWSRNPISFLFNIFNLDLLIFIYYITFREQFTKKYFFILFLYFLFQLLKGWSGFFLTIIIYELYYRSYKRGFNKFLALVPVSFFIGAFVYMFVYPLKFFIRLGVFTAISYLDAVTNLFERLSFFTSSLAGVQNAEEIRKLYDFYGYQHTEILAFFKPVTPSFMFPNKDFKSINNLLAQTVYPESGTNYSPNLGSVSYFYNLFNISFTDVLLFVIFFIALTFLYKIVMDMIEPSGTPGISNFSPLLTYAYFMALFNGGSLIGIQRGWFSIIWTYMFFILVRIIKIKKERV